MAENKTKPTNQKVSEFIDRIDDDKRRRDCKEVLKLMKRVTRKKPVMWGDSMVGFGQYHYKYASGREGDIFLTGFSPRKQNLTLYIMAGFDKNEDLMEKLGKYKTGKSCLYIKSLEDVNLNVLESLVKKSVEQLK